ncbi:NADPH-dependent FMN reductase [Pseudonocardia xishanensis]|uniref:NAD(P)H-dependent oxidoreductase n=1 Tax=Pseudonocardia xishanensis TaxID=630995 RepID=A0ABP8S0K4_9PSEU
MTAPRIGVLVGNPRPRSRTRHVARALAMTLADRTGADRAETIDLADHAAVLFEPDGRNVRRLDHEVRACGLVIVASPAYKASYTGLLKCFLDRVPGGGWAGVTAVPLMTAATPGHAAAAGLALRPVLEELGAHVPVAGLAFPIADFGRVGRVVADWVDEHADRLDATRRASA